MKILRYNRHRYSYIQRFLFGLMIGFLSFNSLHAQTCFLESGGEVVIEAENYTSLLFGSGSASTSYWAPISDGGASGGTALQAIPNTGVYTGLNLNGPRLDYEITFSTPGTYRIWVRGQGGNSSDDSFHAGLDGVGLSNLSGYGMNVSGSWAWTSWANAGDPVTFTVASAGQHTFNIWMREDGVEIDKIVLTTLGNPSGTGPAVSSTGTCGGGGNSAPTASFTASPSSGTAPLLVSVDGAPSSDPDSDPLTYSWDFGDGNTGSGVNSNHSYSAAGTYTLTLTVDDGNGGTDQASETITVTSAGGGNNGPCISETGGEVVIEAESYHELQAGTGNASGSSWTSTSVGSASGGTAMQATPNTGVYTGLDLNGPRMDYHIDFATAGTYTVWIRAQGGGGNDDSFHTGLDGLGLSNLSGYGMNILGPWGWTKWANAGGAVTFTIASPGLHTFNIWMREDGVEIDKIVLSSIGTTPSGTGPAASDPGNCGAPITVLEAPVCILQEPNNHQNLTGITLDDGSSVVIGSSNASPRTHYQYKHVVDNGPGYFIVDSIKGAPNDTVVCMSVNVPGFPPSYHFIDCDTLDLSQYNITNTTLESRDDYDMIASRVAEDGTVMWSRTFGSYGYDWFHANLGDNITVGSDGNLFMAMSRSPLYSQPLRPMIVKINVATGGVIWSKYAPLPYADDRIKSIHGTSDNHLITTGPSFAGTWNCHLQKLDEDGNFVFGKLYWEVGQSTLATIGQQVIEVSDGDYLINGYQAPALGNSNTVATLIKVSNDGNTLTWSKKLTPTNPNIVDLCKAHFNEIQEHPLGGYVAVGYTECDVTQREMLIARIDVNGNFVWIQSYGDASGVINGSGIDMLANGDLVILGYTNTENFIAKVDYSIGSLGWVHGFAPINEGTPINVEVIDQSKIVVITRTINKGALVMQFGPDGMPDDAYACSINDLSQAFSNSSAPLILDDVSTVVHNITTPYQYDPIPMYEYIRAKGVTYKDACPGYIPDCSKDPLILGTPSRDQNYIMTYSPRTELSDPSQIGNLSFARDVHQNIVYFDGLGREVQSVNVGAAPDQADIINFIEYDAFGRVPKQYLPFNDATNPGSYREDANDVIPNDLQAAFYQGQYPKMGGPNSGKGAPFGVTSFEASPRNFSVEQGFPGLAYQLGVNTVKMSNQTNGLDEVYDFGFSSDFSLSPSFFPPNTLVKREYEDENGAKTYEYLDKIGRLICKTSEVEGNTLLNKTYFVYDKFGNIRYVLPPEAVNEIDSGTSASIQDFLNRHCYQYVYNSFQWVIEKKIPGSGWKHIVYNRLGDPVLTQTSEQRLTSQNKPFPEWTLMKYDELGRQILIALWEASSPELQTREELQTEINTITLNGPLFESRANTSIVVNNQSYTLGYTDNVFPSIYTTELLAVTFYDDYNYDFSSDGIGDEIFNPTTALGIPNLRTRGMSTGMLKRILEPDPGRPDLIKSLAYVNQYGQLIQHQGENHLGGIDIQDLEVNFAGELLSVIHNHNPIGSNQGNITQTQLTDRYCYDHVGRLLRKTQKINEQEEIVLVEQRYNELGQLLEKNLNPQNGIALQSIDYKYDIRGNLTNMNELGGPGDCGNGENDMFRLQLHYDDPISDINSGATPRYNGEISSIQWQTGDDCMIKGQAFAYDDMNRLTNSWYAEQDQSEIWVGPSLGRSTSYSYNLNGDIQSLSREGLAGNTGLMDDLTYEYDASNPNRLIRVTDVGNSDGFVDGNTSGNDYGYDNNGNLIFDLNKNITEVQYNFLEKPELITFANGNTIRYEYDAAGTKLRQVVNGTTNQQRDYIGAFQYVDQVLTQILHSEGRKIPDGNGGFQDEFSLKDHLGNVRALVNDLDGDHIIDPNSGELVEVNDYYPFGLRMENVAQSQATPTNRNKFNGKELNLELGLNWYDYGARMYDPAIGRWNSVDAFAEMMQNHSPYNYVYNNPINLIDPDGNHPCDNLDENGDPPAGCTTVLDEVTITGYGPGNTVSGYQARANAFNELWLREFGKRRSTGSGSATVSYKDVEKVSNEISNDPYIGLAYDLTLGGVADFVVGMGETFSEGKESGAIKVASGFPGLKGLKFTKLGNLWKRFKVGKKAAKKADKVDDVVEGTTKLSKQAKRKITVLIENDDPYKAIESSMEIARKTKNKEALNSLRKLENRLDKIEKDRWVNGTIDHSTHQRKKTEIYIGLLHVLDREL